MAPSEFDWGEYEQSLEPRSVFDLFEPGYRKSPLLEALRAARARERESFCRRFACKPGWLDWKRSDKSAAPPWREFAIRCALAIIAEADLLPGTLTSEQRQGLVNFEANWWCWPANSPAQRWAESADYRKKFVADVKSRAGAAPRDYLAEIRAVLGDGPAPSRKAWNQACDLRREAEGGITVAVFHDKAFGAEVRSPKTKRDMYQSIAGNRKRPAPRGATEELRQYLLSPLPQQLTK